MTQNVLCVESLSDRRATRTLLKRLGVKIVHDSGARLMVIDAPDDAARLRERLPAGAQLLPVDKIPAALIRESDPHEALFVRALKLRQTRAYQEAKAAQVPGESPEEQHIFSAPCMEED
ncbi:hypothetical protein DEA8626_03101 [Defluviimonas aquaemixtae]|uniref:Uncharacterized protein n=1 Tax=Albidovulum aquaemixtae TaxID=1542388 RepID=A0A2R8BL33_9RHOB|nr:hypothetical protein [Defluviimonas aquaemixtae]SPH24053.1 hypothetical protein DEA8626_03101 [Defluviimonas aquaemixtae]